MKIRLAKINDATKILQIYTPYVLDSAISFEITVPTLDEFKNRMKEYSNKFPWIVCEIDEQVVGYAYASAHRSRCAYEWSVEASVYIEDKYQGKGIGTKLYKTLFQLLKNQGVVNIFAGITLPNEGSIRLHESLGFLPIGIFKDVGFKKGLWRDVGWWQLQIQKPVQPNHLLPPAIKL